MLIFSHILICSRSIIDLGKRFVLIYMLLMHFIMDMKIVAYDRSPCRLDISRKLRKSNETGEIYLNDLSKATLIASNFSENKPQEH